MPARETREAALIAEYLQACIKILVSHLGAKIKKSKG